MSDQASSSTRVQLGGPIRQGRMYIERPADRILPAALRDGKLCAVFAPRQEGKTSLMVRTVELLRRDGHRCAYIELATAQAKTPDALFGFLRSEMAAALGERSDSDASDRNPSSKFSAWITSTVTNSDKPIVVFIDEIQELLRYRENGEHLMSTIRSLHEGRARNPALARLTFCIAGVARPRDLVKNPASNPFEVDTFIRLEDFTRDELSSTGQSKEILDEIFRWTSGHPFMTATLLSELAAAEPSEEKADALVESIVRETLLSEAVRSEQALSDARLLFEDAERFGGANLPDAVELYRRLLKDERVLEATAAESGVVLGLCGVAAGRTRDGERLVEVRNRIIARMFGELWLQQHEVAKYIEQPRQRWRSLEKAPSALLEGEALAVAVAVAKRADEVTRDQRAFLFTSIEADSVRALARNSSVLEEQYRRERAEIENRYEKQRGSLEETASAVGRFAIQHRRALYAMIALVVSLCAALFFAVFNGLRARELQAEDSADRAAAQKGLDELVKQQKLDEQNRKNELDEAKRKADDARHAADDLAARLNDATSNKEQLDRQYRDALNKADRLADKVAIATQDYQKVMLARIAAEDRAKDAEDVAQATLDALHAETAQRQQDEKDLATERAGRQGCERERDNAKSDALSCRQELDATIRRYKEKDFPGPAQQIQPPAQQTQQPAN